MTIPASTNTTISAWVQNQKRGICCMLTVADACGSAVGVQVVEQPDGPRGPTVLQHTPPRPGQYGVGRRGAVRRGSARGATSRC